MLAGLRRAAWTSRRRLPLRCVHDLADKWSVEHATAVKSGRVGWPRPHSPLASLIGQASESVAAAEAAEAERRAARRLPPIDEATDFEQYLEAVRSNEAELQHAQPPEEAMEERIRREAAERRARRRTPLPQAGPAVDDEVGCDDAERALPAGRFAEAERAPQGAPLPPLRGSLPARPPAAAVIKKMTQAISDFRLTPREVKAHLDVHVIGQEQAKRALAVAVCDHYNFARRCLASPELADRHHVKPNMLLLGPTGVGKTHLMRALARLLGVPFARADATKFSATGYVGGDVDEIVRALVPAAHGDVALAEFGSMQGWSSHPGHAMPPLPSCLRRCSPVLRSSLVCGQSPTLTRSTSWRRAAAAEGSWAAAVRAASTPRTCSVPS